MAQQETFESLLQALRGAWLGACKAAALQHETALAGWMTVLKDGARVPQQVLFRPTLHSASPGLAPMEMDVTDLAGHRWMRPTSLSLSFDCELRQRRDHSWQLFIVDAGRRRWWIGRPRHHVDILIEGKNDDGVEVRFDGQLWRHQSRNKTTGQQP